MVLTWKIRCGQPGRPTLSKETHELIRTMSLENIIWGAPRIRSELMKLGIQISEASVAKYMVRHRKPPSQTCRTFLHNHFSQLVSIDFFTVHTIWLKSCSSSLCLPMSADAFFTTTLPLTRRLHGRRSR